jgi:hypothetical protein
VSGALSNFGWNPELHRHVPARHRVYVALRCRYVGVRQRVLNGLHWVACVLAANGRRTFALAPRTPALSPARRNAEAIPDRAYDVPCRVWMARTAGAFLLLRTGRWWRVDGAVHLASIGDSNHRGWLLAQRKSDL